MKHLAAAALAQSVFGEGRGCFGMHALHSTAAEGTGETRAPQKTQLLFCWAQKLPFCTKSLGLLHSLHEYRSCKT